MKLSMDDRMKILEALNLYIQYEEASLVELEDEEDKIRFGISTKEVKKKRIQEKIYQLQELYNLFEDGSHMICVLPNEFRYAVVVDK